MLSTLLLRHRLAAAASSSPTHSTPLRLRALVVAAAAMSSSSAPAPHGGRKPNRLAAEHSPYLLQHAHNPVRSFSLLPERFLFILSL
jgi:hypothetical protein